MTKAVVFQQFGGPEVLEVLDVPEPHAGPGEIRIRVTAAGLNPVDWKLALVPEIGERFGVTFPSGFGSDVAGVVDEVGDGVTGYAIGDRVYGGARSRAVAEHAVLRLDSDSLQHTPDGLSDEVAGALDVAGRTADAALDAIGVAAGDTVLIGAAAGGVGVLAAQLAVAAGARVIGTASERNHDFLRSLGVEPVAYGPGLADRVRAVAPEGITAATDLWSDEVVHAAIELGVAPERISTIVYGAALPDGVRSTGAINATPGALDRIAAALAAGHVVLPVEATFPIDAIRDAVELQRAGHVRGKVVITF
jgi:NADPH:quinone reductase-like Zn-dependent oxidoreductase